MSLLSRLAELRREHHEVQKNLDRVEAETDRIVERLLSLEREKGIWQPPPRGEPPCSSAH